MTGQRAHLASHRQRSMFSRRSLGLLLLALPACGSLGAEPSEARYDSGVSYDNGAVYS